MDAAPCPGGQNAAALVCFLAGGLIMLVRSDGWGAPSTGRVLVVDDDRDIGDLVHAILTDEGFAVSLLHHQNQDAIRVSVNQLEPDCILLDGASPDEYGPSWADAAWLSHRDRPIPVVMFTAHRAAMDEAEAGESERSQAARFAAILPKPFDIEHLLETVGQAVGAAEPFDGSEDGDHERTAALVRHLEEAGATDIHASTRREWASFTTTSGAFLQIYWWQRDGVYHLIKFARTDGKVEPVGRFYDLGAAISVAMTVDAPPATGGRRSDPISLNRMGREQPGTTALGEPFQIAGE
jgi:CheY-like chemotaxis protein